jgi:serine/threonine-protein kinase
MGPLDDDRMEVIGRYILGAQVGVGGMASVHVGWLTGAADFSRVVAIKRMHPQFLFDVERAARFRDEARLSSRLLHPNIVQVIDVVESKHELLIVMEFVHGVSLRSLLEDSRAAGCRLPTNIIAGILVPALHGLHSAHEATDKEGQLLGLVHRDISPSNIMVSADGHAKILDFGVAKARTHDHITSAGLISGKYGYFSPEQVRSATLDRRTDVFAAGTVLWEMLTGERLFCDPGVDVAPSFDRLLHASIPAPSTLNHDVPKRLDEIVLRALERSPERRYASARTLALDLEATLEVASPPTISGYVECLCSKRLAALSHALAGSRPEVPDAMGVSTAVVNLSHGNDTSLSSISGERTSLGTVAERPPARGRRLLPKWLALGTVLAALLLLLALPTGLSFKSAATDGRATQAPPADPSTSMKPTVLPQPPDALPAAVESAPSASKPVPDEVPARTSRPPAHPMQKRHAAKKAAPSTRPNCDPPTTLDPDGIRVFKEECL